MKKVVLFVIFIAAAVGFFHYGGKISQKSEEVLQNISDSPGIQEIKKQILTSGPLRGSSNPNNAYLTDGGTIIWTNQNRAEFNLPPLKENAKLNLAAEAKVKDMFQKQYFEHISPTGAGPGDLADNVGYQYIVIGENLALGNYKNDKALVEAWMNSPGHRANILNAKFTEIGVAVGKGTYEGKTTWLAVQEFGKPLSACPQIDANLKAQISSIRAEVENLESQVAAKKAELDSLDPKTKEEYEAYNQKVAEYNALVKIYNNKIDILKGLIAAYNSQVNVFNACAGE